MVKTVPHDSFITRDKILTVVSFLDAQIDEI